MILKVKNGVSGSIAILTRDKSFIEFKGLKVRFGISTENCSRNMYAPIFTDYYSGVAKGGGVEGSGSSLLL